MARDLGIGPLFERAEPNADVRGITGNARIDGRATIGAKRSKGTRGAFILADKAVACQQPMVLNKDRNIRREGRPICAAA